MATATADEPHGSGGQPDRETPEPPRRLPDPESRPGKQEPPQPQPQAPYQPSASQQPYQPPLSAALSSALPSALVSRPISHRSRPSRSIGGPTLQPPSGSPRLQKRPETPYPRGASSTPSRSQDGRGSPRARTATRLPRPSFSICRPSTSRRRFRGPPRRSRGRGASGARGARGRGDAFRASRQATELLKSKTEAAATLPRASIATSLISPSISSSDLSRRWRPSRSAEPVEPPLEELRARTDGILDGAIARRPSSRKAELGAPTIEESTLEDESEDLPEYIEEPSLPSWTLDEDLDARRRVCPPRQRWQPEDGHARGGHARGGYMPEEAMPEVGHAEESCPKRPCPRRSMPSEEASMPEEVMPEEVMPRRESCPKRSCPLRQPPDRDEPGIDERRTWRKGRGLSSRFPQRGIQAREPQPPLRPPKSPDGRRPSLAPTPKPPWRKPSLPRPRPRRPWSRLGVRPAKASSSGIGQPSLFRIPQGAFLRQLPEEERNEFEESGLREKLDSLIGTLSEKTKGGDKVEAKQPLAC